VYLSYYFYAYNKLSIEEKCRVMIQHNVWHGQAEDDVSIDLTLTPQLPMYYEVCKAAACNWNSMEITLRKHGKKELWCLMIAQLLMDNLKKCQEHSQHKYQ
jgi:hypothetical protein